MKKQAVSPIKSLDGSDPARTAGLLRSLFVTLAFATLFASCAAYGPYHANTPAEPFNSVRGPKDGRYKLAFIEFGDQGSALDTSQRTAARAQNGILATVSELALAARTPDKKLHRCVLLGHSFGGLVLENTISHSILDASSTGSRNTNPWDMAVAFNAEDSSTGSRQLMSELDYLYKYDPARHAYTGRSPGAVQGSVVDESRPFLIILQSENDMATGQFFPIGTGLFNLVGLRAHWDRVPVPGSNGQTAVTQVTERTL